MARDRDGVKRWRRRAAGLAAWPATAAEPLAEGDEIFVSADPRYCVLL